MPKYNPEIDAELLRMINDYRSEYGAAPTIREIEAELGIPNSTVSRYLSRLRKEGKIEYGRARTIKDTNVNEETCLVPLLGTVSCGPLKLADERHEEYVRLPVSMFGRGDLFLLEADGYSMVNAGIEPGDRILCRQQSSVDNGEIAVVIVDDDATLKRFYRDGDSFRLHPENDDMDDIFVSECRVIGKAIFIIKQAQ